MPVLDGGLVRWILEGRKLSMSTAYMLDGRGAATGAVGNHRSHGSGDRLLPVRPPRRTEVFDVAHPGFPQRAAVCEFDERIRAQARCPL